MSDSLLAKIPRWSASSLYAAEQEFPYWAMERIGGKKFGVGAAAHRGTAAELGLAKFLTGEADHEEAAHQALTEYHRLTALSPDPKREEEGKAVPAFVEQAIAALKDYGKPAATQRMIEWKHPDLHLPFLGYVDFDYDGCLVDLKTTHRLPSSISPSHARQVALYKAATSDNLSARVAYVTPKKSAVYELENHQEHLNAMVQIAKRAEKFLSMFTDKEELFSVLVPNYSHFFWSNPAARQAGYETFGF